MTATALTNWIRKAELLVFKGPGNEQLSTEQFILRRNEGLDLSNMQFVFNTKQNDEQSPNSATIRIYNLKDETANQIQKEFTQVILNAGYVDGAYGTIFNGTIRQVRRGRENNIDKYLDILAADGDVGYNYGFCSGSFGKGSTPKQRVDEAKSKLGLKGGNVLDFTGGILPRGKVMFGMARAAMRIEADSQNASWSMQNGQLQMLPLTGYLKGEAVVLNSQTGMIGLPEQTEQGVVVKTLLDPKIRVGGQVKINNGEINQIVAASGQALPQGGQLKADQWAGMEFPASIAADGLYRVYVIEYNGDIRGGPWYNTMTCLTINPGNPSTVRADG